MSDWLDVMLEEIERRKQERLAAEQEVERRKAKDDESHERCQEK